MTQPNKKTEWLRVPISELCETIVDCVNKTAPIVTGPTPYKMIRTTNVKGGRIDLSEVKYVTAETYQKWTRRQVPRRGDIVLTREAPLGEVGLIRTDDQVFLGQRLVAYRADRRKVDPQFLFYSFQAADLQGQIRSLGSGSTVQHMRVPDAKRLLVRVPPRQQQERIGTILSAYDDLIENNTRRIAILEEMARRLFEHWFVEFEFPGARGLRCVDTEIGATPEGWEVAPVKAVVAFDPPTPVAKSGEKPFVPMAALSTSSMVIDGVERRGGNSGSKFRNGDTLLARITPCLENGKTGYVAFLEDGETAFGSTEFIVLRGRRVSPEFVYLLARSARFREHAIKSMSGATGRQRVRSDNLQDLKIAVPPPNIDTAFRDIARPMFRLIHTLHEANRRLRAARDLLLPKLISGEIEVGAAPIPEAAAAE